MAAGIEPFETDTVRLIPQVLNPFSSNFFPTDFPQPFWLSLSPTYGPGACKYEHNPNSNIFLSNQNMIISKKEKLFSWNPHPQLPDGPWACKDEHNPTTTQHLF